MHRLGWMAVAAALAACGGEPLPEGAERTSAFRQVEVEKGISAKVVVAQGHGYKLEQGEPDIDVDVEVIGDRLRLRRRINPDARLAEVTVYAEEVTTVRLSGQSEVTMDEVSSERLEVRMSGQSVLELGGVADVLDAHLSGQARLNAEALEANRVQLQASGESSCVVTALEGLQAGLDGNARCEVAGDPETRSVRTDGNAVVEFR